MNVVARLFWLLCSVTSACAWTVAHAENENRSINVATYHYDALRTGWNSAERTLSAASFPANFGVLAVAGVDDQVDAQPLLAARQNIAGGVHDVLYVATESNTVYA